MHNERDCIFCGIASGRIRSYTVYENERIMAFLDISPVRPGHTQIIPKEHYPYFEDLPEDLLNEIVRVGTKLARKMKSEFGVKRVGFAFTGSDVAHAHAHVVPLHESDDLTSRRYIVEDTITYRNPASPTHEEAMSTVAILKQAF